jgi:magnesium-transporting ATPase (P-type)
VLASDFAIGEFQCLGNLLLVQGRWFAFRNANFIKNFLYKNMLFAIPLWIFGWFSYWGGLMLYEQWYAAVFNVFYLTAPLMVMAVYDIDVQYQFPKPYNHVP